MGEVTKISWCHHTFNPWIGCAKVSPGCANCYASVNTFVRARRARGLELWGVNGVRHVTSGSNWLEPEKWNRAAEAAGERRRVFCASMADVFEDREDLEEPRAMLFELILRTPALDWLLLTKRPENVNRLSGAFAELPRNIWIGTTCENQEYANRRIPELLKVRARVRFISAEPLLGPLSVSDVVTSEGILKPLVGLLWQRTPAHFASRGVTVLAPKGPTVDWVIVGAESGHGRRPMSLDWVRSLRDQCRAAGTAFFFKQTVDERGNKTELPALDGQVWAEFPGLRCA